MSAIGTFIWYELITSDATAAAKFYGAVVGWKIADRANPQGARDCRMIGRADGGYNGAVLALTADMMEHGARPPGWVICTSPMLNGSVRASRPMGPGC